MTATKPAANLDETRLSADRLSVGIPTNGRPASLRKCLGSLEGCLPSGCAVLVLDSTPRDSDPAVLAEYQQLFEASPHVRVLRFEENVPPGKARRLLAEEVATEFILFMDDDLEVLDDALDKMAAAITSADYDVISGVWTEYGSWRPAGFLYTEAMVDGDPTVVKCDVSYDSLPKNAVVAMHDVLASMLVRTSLFSRVTFDDRYDFFYELYDFFYDCRQHNVKIGVHTGAAFRHSPTPYNSKSSRFFQRKEVDRQRFVDKWGKQPEVAQAVVYTKRSRARRIANACRRIAKAVRG